MEPANGGGDDKRRGERRRSRRQATTAPKSTPAEVAHLSSKTIENPRRCDDLQNDDVAAPEQQSSQRHGLKGFRSLARSLSLQKPALFL